MELDSIVLEKYHGGQMEVQNPVEKYLYRGEIESITVEENELRVKYAWVARGEGYPPLPNKWVKDSHVNYNASLEIYSVKDEGNRIIMQSHITNEIVVLFPRGGSRLDPKKVKGLSLEK